MSTLLYSSYHNYLDLTSGAAISARAFLLASLRGGWRIKTLCLPHFDNGRMSIESFLHTLKNRRLSSHVTSRQILSRGETISYQMANFNDNGLDSSVIFLSPEHVSSSADYVRLESLVYLYELSHLYTQAHPEVYMSYGGNRACEYAASFMKKEGVSSFFFLCNLSYRSRAFFDYFDAVVTPSEFAQRYYFQNIGIDSTVIPPLIDEYETAAPTTTREFLTFLNPTYEKGLKIFASIQRELAQSRPDIPLLVVLSRANPQVLKQEVTSAPGQTLKVLPSNKLPRAFLACTRLLLVPSLVEETFGRVIIEAGMNRIASVCSNRGALPQTVGKGGIVVDLPKEVVSCSNYADITIDPKPWIDAILRLWDDVQLKSSTEELAYQNASEYASTKTSERIIDFLSQFN